MRLIIEARLSDGDSDTVNDGDGVLAVVERRDCSLAQLGLTLAEGRSLLAKVQAELVSKQVEWRLSGCKSGATRPPPNASSSVCCVRALCRERSSPISCAAIRRQKPRSRNLRT